MEKNLIYHNLMQFSIPFWVTPLIFFFGVDTSVGQWFLQPVSEVIPLGDISIVTLEVFFIFLAAMIGTTFPDVDHFAMWKIFKPRNLADFIKKCSIKDRKREVFLLFHNYWVMGIMLVASIIFFNLGLETHAAVFFLSFFLHLMFDYIADVFMLRKSRHWWINGWKDQK